MLLSGCSTPQPKEQLPIQQTLLVKCQEALPELTDGTAGSVLVVMKEWAAIYHVCAARHSGLVDAVTPVSD